MASAMKDKLIKLLKAAIVFYVVVLIALFALQRYLMYLPNRDIGAPDAYGVEAEVLTLTTPDEVQLQAWYLPAAQGMPTILHLHGNAGNMSHRAETYRSYHDAGFGVLALEWRGYGKSTGSPSEEGFYTDARTALDYLHKQGIADNDIIIYGESIGTGAAVQMATEIDARALVLEAPFTSLWQRAAEIHWYVPAKYLVLDRYDNLSKIKQVHEPLLIFHHRGDLIIPYRHGKALYEAANQPKQMLSFDGMQHVRFDRPLLAQEMKEFLAQEAKIR